MAEPTYITTCTPLRISFCGGGTDMPEFYETDGGAVLSTAIDKHIYVTVKRMPALGNRAYRLNYSETEHVDRLDQIKNGIARECLRLVPVEPPLYIATVADLPANSGLGSSSSFAVGLLRALHALRGERVTTAQLAHEAAFVEINMLGRPIGKQDQFAAAFGGLNYIAFQAQNRVSVEPLPLLSTDIDCLFNHLLVFSTGMMRDAGEVLLEQKSRVVENRRLLCAMRDQAKELRDLLISGFDPQLFGKILDNGWEMKRSLASTVTNHAIDRWYDQARHAGALGGKLCGAGGGGFLMLVAGPDRHEQVCEALSDLARLDVSYEPQGARVLFPLVQ